MRLLKISRLYLLSFLIFIIYTSCGIPTVTFLHPPLIDLNNENAFFHNTANANSTIRDQFRGYSIYYKLYNNSNNDGNDCRNDKSIIEASPVSIGPQRLIDQKFQQIIVNDEDQTPQILIPADTSGDRNQILGTRHSITITIADDTITDDIATISTSLLPETEMPLYRNTLSNDSSSSTDSSRHKPLAAPNATHGYSTSDSDVESVTIANAGMELSIAFYALAVGIDIKNFQTLFSTPLFIGYTSLYLSAPKPGCN